MEQIGIGLKFKPKHNETAHWLKRSAVRVREPQLSIFWSSKKLKLRLQVLWAHTILGNVFVAFGGFVQLL